MSRDNAGAGKEFSAGGIVVKDGKVLVVQAENLKGDKVWTFPKGHLEEGEAVEAAALREVEEETGWRCKILKALPLVQYMFTRDKRLIKKKVQWYLMEAGEKTGKPDANEIYDVEWLTFEKAAGRLTYPSDKTLLSAVRIDAIS